MSQVTKRALEQSLKNLLLKKPLTKITVGDIADDCGINRMTFYYHFKDIYDLVEWSCLEDAKRALMVVETIAKDPEIGAIYKGKVTRLMTFGAFVEIAPGKEGLVHISRLDVKRVDKVEDVVAVGDEVLVKVTEIDEQGRLNLSRRDALIEVEGLTPENTVSDSPRPPRREGGFRRDGGRGQRRD